MVGNEKPRCINLDWLEVFCHEPYATPRDADYFRRAGYVVHERAYGTRVYSQMFTIDGADGQPLLEVRRAPLSVAPLGLHLPEECHVRLHNRTCYFDDAAGMLQEFLHTHGYEFKRIARVDVCMDFERFDYGDDPQAFLTRYVKHRYAKINQCNRTTHGQDRWGGCIDNSVSWGSPTSDVGTKMYNKTMELYNPHDGSFKKPYILWAWKRCGLIDDPIRCTVGTGGELRTPAIWRVEFSIRSSVKNWFVIELNGEERHFQSIRNTLDVYSGRDRLLAIFASLAQHYFHFKKYEHNKRKDRCEDKLLFNWQGQQYVYRVGRDAEKICSGHNDIKPLNSLITKLRYYRDTHSARDIHAACQTLIEAMERDCLRSQMTNYWSHDEIVALQLALNHQLYGQERDVAVLLRELKALLKLNDNTAPF